ncbi:hypothetical protein A2I99_03020 [Acholeplasma laidlawii]|nr:hypothetical protein A2I99_03020 [Acholeplasma laidlawii]
MNKSFNLKKMRFVDKLPLYFLKFFIYFILGVFAFVIIFLFYTLFVNASSHTLIFLRGFQYFRVHFLLET